ncbi:MAG TPA: NAD-dependent epimerase/dehydratase family protein [Microbacteriaceae bacterium]|nr:NAD-dependent epimerase/dehydratase family protein [Microbacteriaceae bacterium]
MTATHLVIGAGGVGSALALELAHSGKNVVLVTRRGGGPRHERIVRVAADATNLDALRAAAPEAVAIYNCANPPQYHKWPTLWPPLAKAFLGYAEATGAVLVTCSNLYGYGETDGPLTEDLPLGATWPNGRVRAEMWAEAKALHDAGRIRATEVRASDYVCPGMQSRFGDRVVPVMRQGKPVMLLGGLDTPHSWTAPRDVARLMAAIALDERAWGRAWHVPSNPPKTQREVVADIAVALDVPLAGVRNYPPALVAVLRAVSPLIRAFAHGDYMFNRPFILDDSAARTTFGIEPTPWSQVIGELVAAYPATSS